jgi:hypothetical protein
MGWGCSGRGEGIGCGWRFRCGGSGCIWTIETPFCLQFLYQVVGACAFYCLLSVLLEEVAVTRGNESLVRGSTLARSRPLASRPIAVSDMD